MEINSKIQIIPLGGCGEVGMNMTLLNVYGQYFLIDCGTTFPDQNQIGVKVIYPSVKYLEENDIKIEAWLITHGHEDHIGGIAHFYKKFPAPIFTTAFTAKLIEYKMMDSGIDNYPLTIWNYFEPTLFSNIKVTPFPVNHSIADASGLLIETSLFRIIHTGDFRIDEHPPEKITTIESLKRVCEGKNISLLMSDSTNSFAPNTDRSERDIFDGMTKYFENTKGALIVATFSSHIWRVNTVIELCKKHNRKIFFFGKSLERNISFSLKLNLTNIPEDLFQNFENINAFPRNEICILCTGTQGEAFSGLHRIAYNNIPSFKATYEDTVIVSARVIPGNERPIDSVETQFLKIGTTFIHSKLDKEIHASGHGYSEDLKKCISTVKPKYFMPIHGSYKLLKRHLELATETNVPIENCILAENGDAVTLSEDGIEIKETVLNGRDYSLQGGIFPANSRLYKDRVDLGLCGFVCAHFNLRKNTFDLLEIPYVTSVGVNIDATSYQQSLKKLFERILFDQATRANFGVEHFRNEIRIQFRHQLEKIIGYKTVVLINFQFL